MSPAARAALQQTIDAIESSYEFMLAYAAQGRDSEPQSPEPTIRSALQALESALGGLCEQAQPRKGGYRPSFTYGRSQHPICPDALRYFRPPNERPAADHRFHARK